MTNILGKQLIKDAINNENLSDKKIKIFILQILNEMDLLNKINNELYNDNSKQTSIEKIQKICRKRRQQLKKNMERKKIKIIK